jgi:hypothetical protein
MAARGSEILCPPKDYHKEDYYKEDYHKEDYY